MLGRLERAVERMVEGGIAGAFRLRVQPAEIGRQLERAMLDGRKASVGAAIVPNRYLVQLHPDDAVTFGDWEEALCREMERWLAELAFARGLVAIGPIEVRLIEDRNVPRRTVQAQARFAEAATEEPGTIPPAQTTTLLLRPVDGVAPPFRLESGGGSVGRAEDNDVVISDPEVSRYHARIDIAASGWVVSDLGSTNGTWINGEAVARAPMARGDVVAFGRLSFYVAAE